MKKRRLLLIGCLIICLLLAGCGGTEVKDLPELRKLSWEGTELTVTVGTNKSTGCEWKASFEDDSVIGYSVNRKFHLMTNKDGQAVGYSEIGFKGKSGGQTTITLTTPCGWDGTGEGYTYVVTVMVGEDGTIQSAEGENLAAESKKQTEGDLYADTYTCIGLCLDGQYLSNDDCASWTTTLDADGGGSLDWGKDNRGPISEWSVEDGKLTIKAGVSVIDGSIADGVMLLNFGDGLIMAFAGRDADPDKLDIISS